MYEIEGPAARPSVLRRVAPAARTGVRAAVRAPGRRRARGLPLAAPWSHARGCGPVARRSHRRPPCALDGRQLRPAVSRRPSPGIGLRGAFSCGNRFRRTCSLARRSFSAWPGGQGAPRRVSAVSRILPPSESPPSGPPVVLGVGVVLRRFPQGAQEVSEKFLDEFLCPQDVHSLSSGEGGSSPGCPQLCAQDDGHIKTSSCAKIGTTLSGDPRARPAPPCQAGLLPRSRTAGKRPFAGHGRGACG